MLPNSHNQTETSPESTSTDLNCHIPVLIREISGFLILNQDFGVRQTKKIWQKVIGKKRQKYENREEIESEVQSKSEEEGQFGENLKKGTPRQPTVATPLVVPPTLASYTQEWNFDINLKTKLKIFDGTLGGLGYFDFMANLCQEKGIELNYFGCDLDNEVIEKAHQIEKDSEKKSVKLKVKQANFVDFIEEFPDEFFDGIVLDLGFSSNQLSSSGRGFSYQKLDEVVDLRYDDSTKMACWQKLNLVKNPHELGNIIYRFSGEKLAQKISANILTFIENLRIETRQKHPEITVKALVDVISMSIPAIFRKKTNQILSRVWQALRIWTNNELEVLEAFLPIALKKLAPGGKLAIVSFHSLEDKIVASFMRDLSIPESDEYGNKTQDFQLLTTRSVVAGETELAQNSRSRSALLRVLERLE